MTPEMFTARVSAMIGCVVVLGCAEPETGNDNSGDEGEADLGPGGDPEVMDDINLCKGVPYEVDFDQLVSDSFSAADVVAGMQASYVSELQWSPQGAPVAHDLPTEPGRIELEFDFSSAPDRVRWVESIGCDGTVSCDHSCRSRLEIPAVLRVTADDGTLAEELPVMVGATGDTVFVNHTLDLTEVSGSLATAVTLDPSWTLLGYHVQVELHQDNPIRGRIRLSVVDPVDALWFHALGVWPPP